MTRATTEKRPVHAARGMVVTNHPLASAAGAEMLAGGGTPIGLGGGYARPGVRFWPDRQGGPEMAPKPPDARATPAEPIEVRRVDGKTARRVM